MIKCNQIEELLSGYLDGELAQDKRQLVETHIDQCEHCKEAYKDIEKIRLSVGALSLTEMTNEEWKKMMNDTTVKTSRSLGWLAFIAGTLVLLGYAAYEYAVDDNVELGVKLGTLALVVGLFGLFLSVLRQRFIARKTDKYKDVEI